jgi:hypothetical protein
MREKLTALSAALQELKRASVFKKSFAAETALLQALELFEEIVEEIEKLKGSQTDADRRT